MFKGKVYLCSSALHHVMMLHTTIKKISDDLLGGWLWSSGQAVATVMRFYSRKGTQETSDFSVIMKYSTTKLTYFLHQNTVAHWAS